MPLAQPDSAEIDLTKTQTGRKKSKETSIPTDQTGGILNRDAAPPTPAAVSPPVRRSAHTAASVHQKLLASIKSPKAPPAAFIQAKLIKKREPDKATLAADWHDLPEPSRPLPSAKIPRRTLPDKATEPLKKKPKEEAPSKERRKDNHKSSKKAKKAAIIMGALSVATPESDPSPSRASGEACRSPVGAKILSEQPLLPSPPQCLAPWDDDLPMLPPESPFPPMAAPIGPLHPTSPAVPQRQPSPPPADNVPVPPTKAPKAKAKPKPKPVHQVSNSMTLNAHEERQLRILEEKVDADIRRLERRKGSPPPVWPLPVPTEVRPAPKAPSLPKRSSPFEETLREALSALGVPDDSPDFAAVLRARFPSQGPELAPATLGSYVHVPERNGVEARMGEALSDEAKATLISRLEQKMKQKRVRSQVQSKSPPSEKRSAGGRDAPTFPVTLSSHPQMFATSERGLVGGELVQTSSCRTLFVLGVPVCHSCQDKAVLTVACLFQGIRRIRIMDGVVSVSGFCRAEDLLDKDKLLGRSDYLPSASESGGALGWSRGEASYVLQNLARPFRKLAAAEGEFLATAASLRPLSEMGVFRGGDTHRELCDSCATTVFNLHLFCADCGLVLCPGCLRDRLGRKESDEDEPRRGALDVFGWPTCFDLQKKEARFHKPAELTIAQLFPDPFPAFSSTVLTLLQQMEQVMEADKISDHCLCEHPESGESRCYCEKSPSTSSESTQDLPTLNLHWELRRHPTLSTFEAAEADALAAVLPGGLMPIFEPPPIAGLPVLGERFCPGPVTQVKEDADDDGLDWHDLPRPLLEEWIASEPSFETRRGGKLLYLHGLKMGEAEAIARFQANWRLGLPVLVTHMDRKVELRRWREMWDHRRLGAKQASDDPANAMGQIINCLVHRSATVSSRDFWRGYADMKFRDEHLVKYHAESSTSHTMQLKFKDYPANDTFKGALNAQFHAFCSILPLPQYSAPQGVGDWGGGDSARGRFNLVRALPPHLYVIPDLGPKMYTAYGMMKGSELSKGTTNIHLDISDAVNVMVDVTVPRGETTNGIDSFVYHEQRMPERLLREGLPEDEVARITRRWWEAGALWTIWSPDDTAILKDWLKGLFCRVKADDASLRLDKLTREAFKHMDDPIHDQSVYLTAELRRLLEKERGVVGFTFVQMLGDAVFIPAGAAHQVQNILSCVKVAEDFVTPEGVSKCAEITDQFRRLSLRHDNREDKLQLNNILYHAVKEAVTVLLSAKSAQ